MSYYQSLLMLPWWRLCVLHDANDVLHQLMYVYTSHAVGLVSRLRQLQCRADDEKDPASRRQGAGVCTIYIVGVCCCWGLLYMLAACTWCRSACILSV
jgi:hypothetical protein